MNTNEIEWVAPPLLPIVDLQKLAALLTEGGHPAYVEHTGGGCATVYVAPWYDDGEGERRPLWMAGPGGFLDYPYSGPAGATTEEISFGDGLGEGVNLYGEEIDYDKNTDPTEFFAFKCLEHIATHTAAAVAHYERAGLTAYNGIG